MPARRALVIADGDTADRDAIEASWPGSLEEFDVVVAADAGARHAERLGVTIDRWAGDADSIDPTELDALRRRGVTIELAARDKDESDTELAIRAALRDGATDITIVGAFGGRRLDHTLANIALLADATLAGARFVIVDAPARVRLARAPGQDGGPIAVTLEGRVGDVVTLLPFGTDAEGVRTSGLRFPLRDETLRLGAARGLSNVRLAEDARLELRRGLLLVIETPATLAG
jgi:thiamine pyrophosphokinase